MFNIPSAFSGEEESYITMPAFRRFAMDRIELKTTVDRPTMIKNIEAYANVNADNQEEVEDWLDHTLVEGIKELQIKRVDEDGMHLAFLQDDEYIKGVLEKNIKNPVHRHLSGNVFTQDLNLYRYEIGQDIRFGRCISLYMGKLLSMHDKRKGEAKVQYPVFVEVFVDLGLIVARAKSKSGIYKYMDEFVLEEATTTTAEKELVNAIKYVSETFNLKLASRSQVDSEFRGKLFRMLDTYTTTPKQITELVEAKSENIEKLVRLIMNEICSLPIQYLSDVRSNVNNMIEKYFSISYPHKDIFTKDRDAYPLKLSATDEEDSRVEQIAALEEPLQSKAIFFDNKKMLQKSRMCDGVLFVFKRRNPKYCDPTFKVKIVVKKDFCTLKFTEYTMEEDIKYVLYNVINPE